MTVFSYVPKRKQRIVLYMPKSNPNAYESRTCKQCGIKFRYLKSLLNDNRHTGEFCSSKCFHNFRRIKLTCQKCGNEFVVINGLRHRKYCSLECAGVAKKPRILKTCVICEKEYEVLQKQERRYVSKCCSFDCLIKYNAQINRRNAKEAKNRTGCKEWLEIRDGIKQRDAFTCNVCGSEDKLIVHHKVEWRKTKDNRPENLVTLCRSCHAKIHFGSLFMTS